MKKMQCEVCGSTEIRKTSDEVFECQSCGIQYSKSEVQKLLVEITGEVKIDRNEEVANMIKNVQRLYKNRDYDKVISSCDNILNMQPDNVEAILYSGYSSAYNTTVANIRLGDAYRAANDAIKIQYETLGKSGEFFDFCSEVLAELNSITDTIFEFCRETIVSANVMNPANRDIFDSLKGGMDAKEEINDLQELVSMVVLNFLTKFDLLMIMDFSNAPIKFFINMITVMHQQYRGTYKNKIPQVKMDLDRLILFKLPQGSAARKKAESLCAKFSGDKFMQSNLEIQSLLNEFLSQKIEGGEITEEDKRYLENEYSNIDGVDVQTAKRIEMLLGSGQTIEAIKIYREATGVGLAEAKEAIDKCKKQNGLENNSNSSSTISNVSNSTKEENADVKKKLNICIGIGVVGFVLAFIFILFGASTDNVGTMSAAFPMLIVALIAFVCGAAINSNAKKKGYNSGCYVATAVYGSYDCPQVWTLRRFRDNTLASTWYGRAFIHTYYTISPTLVKWFGNTKWFKKMWKGKLDRMVANLQTRGVESTPYTDKNW